MIIAICDDEKLAIESIRRELEKAAKKLQITMDIYEYQTGEELLEDIIRYYKIADRGAAFRY